MNLKKLWKSNEEIEYTKELESQKQIQNELRSSAQDLLITRIAQDYLVADNVPKEEKDLFISMFPVYEIGVLYDKGNKVVYMNDVYEVVEAHTSEMVLKPNETPALYKLFYQLSTSEGEDIIPGWKRPVDFDLAYNTGDLVIYKDKVYESVVDSNVWSPTDYGWVKIV